MFRGPDVPALVKAAGMYSGTTGGAAPGKTGACSVAFVGSSSAHSCHPSHMPRSHLWALMFQHAGEQTYLIIYAITSLFVTISDFLFVSDL